MIWLLIIGPIWLLVALIVGVGIGRSVAVADHQERQCSHQFDQGGRCQWFADHPESWGHQWSDPSVVKLR